MTTPTPCAYPECDRTTVPGVRWDRASAEQRHHWRTVDNAYRHQGRQLCQRCVRRARLDGTLHDFPRATVSREDVLAEWEHHRDRDRSRAHQVRLLAPRMGMSFDALERALDRAQAAA